MLARTEAAPLRLNVGCGASPTPGWLNLDNSLSVRLALFAGVLPPHQRAFAELAKLRKVRHGSAVKLPAATGTVDAIYSSHMMEHIDRREAREFLREALRALRPGGVLRLALPDLRLAAAAYISHGDADRFVAGILMGYDRPRSLRQWIAHVIPGPRHHLWMYDGASLVRLLTSVGFSEATVVPAGSTRIAAPGDLDLSERADESVYVEAIKPLA